MLAAFFEKNDKLSFIPGKTYFRVSSNLDSHFYVLERVKNGDTQYIQDNYFSANHPQLISYFTCWKEKEVVLEEAPVIKKVKEKEKKGILGGLLGKKNKAQQIKAFSKETKEEHLVTTIEDILYIQLESFQELDAQINNLTDIRESMAFIYLLACRVFEDFGIWPKMIPGLIDFRYKFIKKGKSLERELVRLFEYITKNQKLPILKSWSQEVANHYVETGNEDQKIKILGNFLHNQLQTLLKGQFQLSMKKGQEYINQTIIIEDCFTLTLKQSDVQLAIDEYCIIYLHQDTDNRQIMLEHNFFNSVILQGNRNNFVIKYLKQFSRQ